MFRNLLAACVGLALIASAAPAQAPPAAPAQSANPAGHRDSDTVYFKETAGPDGSARLQYKTVSYLPLSEYLLKVARITRAVSGVENDDCHTEVAGFKKLAVGSYTKAWSFSDTSCDAHREYEFQIPAASAAVFQKGTPARSMRR